MSAEPPSTESAGADNAGQSATLAALIEQKGVTLPLETERLSLSLLAESEAAELWDYWRLPQTSEWTASRPVSAEALISDRLQAGSTLAIRRRDGDNDGFRPDGSADGAQIIGDITVTIQDAWSHPEVAHLARGTQAELGCAFHPDATGHGFALEAVIAVLDLIVDLGIRRVEAFCMADNTASWRLLDRLGLRREGTYIGETLHRDHGWVDAYSYAILASEWQAKRS
ncbi:GNAT family N-acetyltransferase [Brevibacterium luteolum]|uniref:GNAT family N-acetyltransferase n=1 Tax=Brevibacterium luteolum TaxID=199591 RepID=UPI00223C1064|nr:GNAT family protein [Brevibacterium luteolum]MCT1873471.1 GNAT family N-acetyltransferase [Brevibacterium luteolum]MCT1890859.1 GNAT family N-acetyltransferase [Brevibacterium luteolum]MCT1893345.1 GNAT family N-acetyltransferase [Brevibacterium luteolum]MCT1924105.1 GNAT family N-acetyltransferase [Brevibacterium luteolum]